MSRQFRSYALPTDIEYVMGQLRRQCGVRIYRESSPDSKLFEITSPLEELRRDQELRGRSHARWYLSAENADVRVRYYARRAEWLIQTESEAIEFSGFDFDGMVLLQGRFYFQTDILIGDEVCAKRPEFLRWADRVFRMAKRMMPRSKALDAYVGEDAARWRENGGRFVSSIKAGGAFNDEE